MTPELPGSGVVGGALGKQARNYLRAGVAEKTLWLIGRREHPERLHLLAQRTSGAAPVVELELPLVRGTPLAGAWPQGWDRTLAYGSEFVLPSAGCWRVSLAAGSDEDAVVFRVDP